MAREMKDSGIEWIGEIPRDWKIEKYKHCFVCSKEIVGNKSNSVQLLSLTTRGIKKRSKNDTFGKVPDSYDTYQVVKQNDIVMCLFDLDVSAVFSGISPYNGMISPAYKVLNSKENVFPKYADYWFSYIFDGRKYKYYSKNLRFTLNYDEFAGLEMLLPSLNEQKCIANYLDTKCAHIDSVIEKTRAAIEEYKKLKQAVITQAVTKGIRPNREMKDSGIEWIGEIPREWSLIRIKWLLNERNERSASGMEEPLSMSQKYGLIPTSQMDMIPNIASSFVGSKLCYKNDLVFNKLKAHLGVFAVSNYDGLVSPDYAVYYSTNIASLKYLEFLFKTPQYIGEFRKKSTGVGAGLTRLYTSGLYSIYCALPDYLEQSEIVAYLDEKTDAIDSLIQKKEQFITELEAYKKSLIYEYVTGKKEVTDNKTISISVEFQIALLMCNILKNSDIKGRIHLQKVTYASDTLLDLFPETQYYRYPHGPYDLNIERYESIMESQGWVTVDKSKGYVRYKKTKRFIEFESQYQDVFKNRDKEIRKICNLFNVKRTSKAEKMATVLASWNDFLIDGVNPTDDMIINDIVTNWTANKANISVETWRVIIQQLKENQMIPKGYGKHTLKKEQNDYAH